MNLVRAALLSIAFLTVTLIATTASQAASTPDLNGGTWQVVDPPQTIHTISGKQPPLLPMAKMIYEKHLAARKAGDLSFDPSESCLSPGMPRVLYLSFPFEFVQRPDKIVILYEWNRLVRLVDMNVPQPEVLGPVYLGQSVGKWQAGSLIIDSIGFSDNTVLDAAGLPHSEALHVIEKYTPSADGKQMKLNITIDDPKTYAVKWQTALTLQRNVDGEIHEDVCLERKAIKWTWKQEAH